MPAQLPLRPANARATYVQLGPKDWVKHRPLPDPRCTLPPYVRQKQLGNATITENKPRFFSRLRSHVPVETLVNIIIIERGRPVVRLS